MQSLVALVRTNGVLNDMQSLVALVRTNGVLNDMQSLVALVRTNGVFIRVTYMDKILLAVLQQYILLLYTSATCSSRLAVNSVSMAKRRYHYSQFTDIMKLGQVNCMLYLRG